MSETPQSKGGKNRALSLTGEERHKIAQDAAKARWGSSDDADAVAYVHAVVDADIKLGDLILTCAVIPDGTRVLSERGISRALGRTRSGSHWQKKREQGANLPLYLTSDNLKPFISNDLIKALSSPIWYRPKHGGRLVAGIPAVCLSDICDAWINAEEAGKLYKSQIGIAAKARTLMRGFQKLGIIALIDEATGYQQIRAHDELQTILSAYILPEHRPWIKAVLPVEFTKEIYRVYGWVYSPDNRGPRYASKLIRKLIYEPLPPPVLPELDRLNPANSKWQRKRRHRQHLTDNTGLEHFKSQLSGVMALLRATPDNSRQFFWTLYERAYGRQRSFDFGVEDAEWIENNP